MDKTKKQHIWGLPLAHDVYSPNGRFLLSKGTRLEPAHLRILSIWGVEKILVHDPKDFSPKEISLTDLLPPVRYQPRSLSLTRPDISPHDQESVLLKQVIQDGVSLGSFETSLNQLESPLIILEETESKIKKYFHFETTSFFLINEDNSDLTPAFFYPKKSKSFWTKVLDSLILERFIFQAITKQKSIVVSAPDQDKTFLIHALATKSRTRGIFLGLLNGEDDFYPVKQLLLSIIMFCSAHMLESYELYSQIKKKNTQLEKSLQKLKKTEQELIKHKEELEQLVAERTSELVKTNEDLKHEIEERKNIEKKLILAQKKAKEANQVKNEFLANLSHELRTPLNAILGMTELVLLSTIDDEAKENLNIVYKAAQGLSTLIDDLLDMSLIKYGQLEIKEENFFLTKTLDSILDIFMHQAQKKGLRISYHIDQGIPDLLIGDVSRVRQVLVNLVGNAIKFTDKGEIKILVRLQELTHEHSITLLFAVRDTGCGIPKDKMDLIFERFTQVDGSYTRQHGGTGLGLALCKKIVTLLGGRIWAESTPGQGSTFYFTLPFKIES
ncbi:hypothetical protein KFV02_07735 [Desulfohalobiaceae bacterium Ax17]|uniref:ATP-binding protein n=1 Tax=Desulfovulcanus ferrireducens TaxID=2831190 RepID=UPI00207BC141|nr:ATP-binding protein [Desulfovulcanus ferrireducens]MBT8763822.1 hypothetical protein [Desulfovulcanus ferrireducens]